ncbi:MAG: sigma-70 family RNA polymerase sigma factor [Oscillospiraceae bacterium]|nr:sigma-70 family RNA polymerase sigma factor [Oscillospiraceae bacterium]
MEEVIHTFTVNHKTKTEDSPMDDTAIVALYLNRDENAISETEKKFGRYLTKIALNTFGSVEDSKETVNDTYLKAWNSIPPHEPQVLSTYLGKITRELSIDLFRKRSRQKRQGSSYALSLSELEECAAAPDNAGNPEQALESKDLSEKINGWLKSVPKETRDVFVGRYYFMDSVKDVAFNHDMSVSKAKVVLHRARNDLKKYLEKEGYIV